MNFPAWARWHPSMRLSIYLRTIFSTLLLYISQHHHQATSRPISFSVDRLRLTTFPDLTSSAKFSYINISFSPHLFGFHFGKGKEAAFQEVKLSVGITTITDRSLMFTKATACVFVCRVMCVPLEKQQRL